MRFKIKLILLAVLLGFAFIPLAAGAIERSGELFSKAQVAKKQGDYIKAFALFEHLANLGHKKSQLELSKLYREGKGTKKNLSKANKYYSKATGKQAPAQQKAKPKGVSGYGEGSSFLSYFTADKHSAEPTVLRKSDEPFSDRVQVSPLNRFMESFSKFASNFEAPGERFSLYAILFIAILPQVVLPVILSLLLTFFALAREFAGSKPTKDFSVPSAALKKD